MIPTGELAEGRNFQRLSRIKTATWNLKAKCPLLHPQKFCTWSSCGGSNRGRMLLISILYDPQQSLWTDTANWHFSNLPDENLIPNFILPSNNSSTSCGQSREKSMIPLFTIAIIFFHFSADLRQIPVSSGSLRRFCLGQHCHAPCINCRRHKGCFSQCHESATQMPTQQSPDAQISLCHPLPKTSQKSGEIILSNIYYYIILLETSKGNFFLLFTC